MDSVSRIKARWMSFPRFIPRRAGGFPMSMVIRTKRLVPNPISEKVVDIATRPRFRPQTQEAPDAGLRSTEAPDAGFGRAGRMESIYHEGRSRS